MEFNFTLGLIEEEIRKTNRHLDYLQTKLSVAPNSGTGKLEDEIARFEKHLKSLNDEKAYFEKMSSK